MKIRVIDLETTGFEPPEAQVCESGWSDVASGMVMPHVSFLHGVQSMPPEVRAVHHIRLEDLVDKPPLIPAG